MTQAEIVENKLKEKQLSIKELSKKTGILESNIRRILGQGTIRGKFKRISRGVYALQTKYGNTAVIKTGDALQEIKKLNKEGYKFDTVFLDIPYKTRAVIGGNRGVKYDLISPGQFNNFLIDLKTVLKNPNTPVYFMFSTAPSGKKQMDQYLEMLSKNGFKKIEEGQWNKLDSKGNRVKNMRGKKMSAEGIHLYSLSGKVFTYRTINLNFSMERIRKSSEKPLKLMNAIFERSSHVGDWILDPFAGSGVSGESALKLLRNIVLFEKSEDRVKKEIIPRISNLILNR